MSLSKDNKTWREEMFPCKYHLSLSIWVNKAIDLTYEHIILCGLSHISSCSLLIANDSVVHLISFSPLASGLLNSTVQSSFSQPALTSHTHTHTRFVNYTRNVTIQACRRTVMSMMHIMLLAQQM